MKLAVFGLGYVGTVSAAAFARLGVNVIGVDVNRDKVAMLCGGESPVLEPGLAESIADAVQQGLLHATINATEAVESSDLSLVCVGTPSNQNGSLNTDHVFHVAGQIAETLRNKVSRHVVVIRSTVLPGTTEAVAKTIAQVSGKELGKEFGVCMNPEFLREGSALKDFYGAAHTIIGESDSESGELVARLYSRVDSPVIRTDLRTAEILKYANNAFHALKIAFANEIGATCNRLSIDGQSVMKMLCSDTKLNISPAYLRPGFAFGGSCLPKDLRALNYFTMHNDIATPLLASIVPSNDMHLQRAIHMVEQAGNRDVGLLGLTFKAGTDDLRESPMVRLAETLLGKGYDLKIYDPNLVPSNLIGSNKDFIFERIPHLTKLLVDDGNVLLRDSATIVVGTGDACFHGVLAKAGSQHTICDFVNVMPVNGKVAASFVSLS
jgi:GDP-mannose 6-dehydrogenase